MDFTFVETMELINAFKQYPILYDPSVLGYNDRKSKAKAWKTIAASVRVHSELCKRKIESLMSSCRREKAKIIKSRASGNPEEYITPKWRYWNALKFLRGLADDAEDPLGTAPEQDVMESNVNSPWSTSRMLAHKHRKAVSAAEKTSLKKVEPQKTQAPPPCKEEDEYSAIGVTVEAKLRKMDDKQRLYAENIINQALYKGLLFQLTAQSEIRSDDLLRNMQQQKQNVQHKPKPNLVENTTQHNPILNNVIASQPMMMQQPQVIFTSPIMTPMVVHVPDDYNNAKRSRLTMNMCGEAGSSQSEEFKSMTML